MNTLLELIQTHCVHLGDNYPAIADFLNAPTTIENPRAGETDTATIPIAITLDKLMALVPPTEAAMLYVKMPTLITNLQQAIDADNRQWLGYLLQVVADPANGVLSAQTAASLLLVLNATETIETVQPNTIPGLSLASAAGLGFVTASQVQAALNIT